MTRLLSGLAMKYLRARHSRGHGVHSPFAYETLRLLKISRKTGFYADDELFKCALPDGGRKLGRDAVKFHRLCSNLIDGNIYLSANAPKAISLAVSQTSPRLRTTSSPGLAPACCIGYFLRGTDSPQSVASALASDCQTAWLAGYSDSEVRRIAAKGGATLTLLGNRNSVLFRRQQMQPVEYTVFL